MQKRLKKLLVKFIILVLCVSGVVFYLFQKRKYYCLTDDKCITVWKTAEGAFIIPGKYTSWFKPTDNYIKTDNLNCVVIIYDKKSKYDYIIFNAYNKELLINMSKYKIKYYDYNQEDEFSKEYYVDHMLKPGLECEPIDIGELY